MRITTLQEKAKIRWVHVSCCRPLDNDAREHISALGKHFLCACALRREVETRRAHWDLSHGKQLPTHTRPQRVVLFIWFIFFILTKHLDFVFVLVGKFHITHSCRRRRIEAVTAVVSSNTRSKFRPGASCKWVLF